MFNTWLLENRRRNLLWDLTDVMTSFAPVLADKAEFQDLADDVIMSHVLLNHGINDGFGVEFKVLPYGHEPGVYVDPKSIKVVKAKVS